MSSVFFIIQVIHTCTFSDSLRIMVALTFFFFFFFTVIPLLPLLTFFESLLIYTLFLLMAIFNFICIQITSPGGTPIRGKNAGYRQCPPVLTAPSIISSVHFLLLPQCVTITSPVSSVHAPTLFSIPPHCLKLCMV